MDLTTFWLVSTAFIGAFLQAALGFGYAVFVMVFFPLILPSINEAVTVCALTGMLISGSMLFSYRKSAQPKKLLWPIGAYFVVAPFAIRLSTHIPHREMSIILGLFLLALGLYYLFSADKLRIPCTPTAGIAAGSVTGLFGGLFSVTGPPAALYCLSVTDSKDAYVGTLQFFFFITNIYTIIVRVINGFVTGVVLTWSLFAGLGMVAGILLGGAVYKRMDLSSVKRWVFLFISLMGVWTIASSLL
ncbi:MAG: sulfite exporter TauE/SafE family protein [Candidatus Pelethousia sp.]|nr:sulfite exporter TauE/SafE family protein [Candidatus Pelethousia sp.]